MATFYEFLAARRDIADSTAELYVAISKRWQKAEMLPIPWLQAHLTTATPRGTASSLIAAGRWYSKWKGLDWDESQVPKMRWDQQDYRDTLTDEELQAYYAVAASVPQPYKTILLILPRTGLRIQEACNLRRDQIGRHGRSWGIVFPGKGDKYRFVPFSRSVHGDMLAYFEWLDAPRMQVIDGQARKERPKRSVWVFPSPRNPENAVKEDTVRTHLRAVRSRIKMENAERVSPHVLRHTFATRALARGVPLKSLQVILGHERIATTERYLHPTIEMLRDAVDAVER